MAQNQSLDSWHLWKTSCISEGFLKVALSGGSLHKRQYQMIMLRYAWISWSLMKPLVQVWLCLLEWIEQWANPTNFGGNIPHTPWELGPKCECMPIFIEFGIESRQVGRSRGVDRASSSDAWGPGLEPRPLHLKKIPLLYPKPSGSSELGVWSLSCIGGSNPKTCASLNLILPSSVNKICTVWPLLLQRNVVRQITWIEDINR